MEQETNPRDEVQWATPVNGSRTVSSTVHSDPLTCDSLGSTDIAVMDPENNGKQVRQTAQVRMVT